MFQGIFGNVCEVAVRYWSRMRAMPGNELDPRQLYSLAHKGTLHALIREYGLGLTQVLAITMKEARSACLLGDADSVQGVSMCAAFALEVLMGGRRPRSLTAIRLEHCQFSVVEVDVGGQRALAPGAWCEGHVCGGKYDDIQGPRSATDMPSQEGYSEYMHNSCAYWLYRLLVMRGAFTEVLTRAPLLIYLLLLNSLPPT